jgi:tRNA 2-thiocytidine biosynthesis protein TtcA
MSSNIDTPAWNKSDSISREAKEILRHAGRASRDFSLIEPGDHILVACSGGKDSYTLAWALHRIQARAPFEFRLTCLNLDPGFGDYEQQIVGDYLSSQGAEVVLEKGLSGTVCEAKMSPEDNPCWLCARMRRGVLYTKAKQLGCNKIALGHHADDSVETLLINMLYASQIKGMPPRLLNDEGSMMVIRPLIYLKESTIRAFSQQMRMPVVGCGCPHERYALDSKRAAIKALIADLDTRIPDVREHLLAAMTRVKPSHLLDKELYDFIGFERK